MHSRAPRIGALSRRAVGSMCGFGPEGVDGFAALSSTAVKFQLHGETLLVASLDDIIQMKDATGRAQERHEAVVLRELARRERGGSNGERGTGSVGGNAPG